MLQSQCARAAVPEAPAPPRGVPWDHDPWGRCAGEQGRQGHRRGCGCFPARCAACPACVVHVRSDPCLAAGMLRLALQPTPPPPLRAFATGVCSDRLLPHRCCLRLGGQRPAVPNSSAVALAVRLLHTCPAPPPHLAGRPFVHRTRPALGASVCPLCASAGTAPWLQPRPWMPSSRAPQH